MRQLVLLLLVLLGFSGLGAHGSEDGTIGRAARKLRGGPGAAAAAAAASRRHPTSGGASDPIQGQVAYGTVAARSDFPYIARLLYADDTWYGCGGTLVRGRAVVTAAHCFFVDGGQPDDPVASVRIGVVNSLKDRLGIDYQQRRVVKAVLHPLYQPGNDYVSTWDVAVLILDRPVNLTKNPTALLAPARMALPAGLQLWAAGWGRTELADESVLLRKARLPVVGRAECDDFYGGTLEFEHICAGGQLTRQDTCDGDSGGPLVLKRPGKRDLLVGITSYGVTDVCGAANGDNIGAYTFVGNPQINSWLLKTFDANRV